MCIQNTLGLVLIITAITEGSLLCVSHNSLILPNLTKENDLHLNDTNFDCINSIKNESTMFAITSPNELFMIPTENISVFGEFRSKNEDEFDKSRSTVVITTRKANFDNLNGLKYCHPGANIKTLPWVTNEFIATILSNSRKSKAIPSNQTLLEYNYFVLNSTLGPSCIHNIWSSNTNLDNSLRKLYPKLLELCSEYKSNLNPFEQSLQCLIDGHGDIALSSLEKVEEYKEKLRSEQKEYFLLCKNNTLQDLNNPCVWKTTSWPILIGNKNHTDRLLEVQETLKNFTAFSNIIPLSNYTKVLDENIILHKSLNVKHNKTLAWCTLTQEEQDDCELLQKIFIFYDIPIKITSCIRSEAKYLDKYECIDNIRGISSVTFIHSNQFFAARRAKLEISLYTDTGSDLIKSILLVNTNAIKTIDDLENKKGCFSEFGSIDWFSFVSAFKTKILKDSCFYDLELSKFVNESCMPGIRDDLRSRKDDVDVERLCKICEASTTSPTAVNCDPNQNVNIFASSRGALDCLMKPVGQFAVVKIDNNFNISSEDIKEGIMVMCKNGTLVEFNEIDDECYLSLTPYGGIVTKKGLEEDIKLAFLELKQKNLQYGLLPPDILNSFPSLFSERHIKDFLDAKSCDITASNSCKHIAKLDHLVVETDTCPNGITKISKNLQGSSTGTIVAITILCLVIICAIVVGSVLYYKKNRNNRQNTSDTRNAELKEQTEPFNESKQNANGHSFL